MITKVEVYSAQPDAPELALGGFLANNDPVQIRNIDGIGPVKSDITTTPFASGVGELFQNAALGKRNILLTLGLNPDWSEQTMTSLRQLLYRYLMTGFWTKLRFFSTELDTVDIEGYVESFEPNMFSQDPEMIVSIICPKPDFVAPDATIYYGTVDDGTAELEFDYEGNVNTGFEVRIDQSIAVPAYTGPLSISMQREPEDAQVFDIDPGPITINGTQYFKLSTLSGNKRAQTILIADGVATNLLSLVTPGSPWAVIQPGTNLFKVAADDTGQAWTLAFFNRYGGL